MAKAGRQTTKTRARRPRRGELRFALDELHPKEQADARRRWLADEKARVSIAKQWLAGEKARVSAAKASAKELEQGRREIDRYLAIRDNQIRPLWMKPPKSKRKARQGVERDYPYDKIRTVALEALRTGTDERRICFYNRVREICRQHRPRIRTPANDRTMGRIIGDLYQNTKRPARKNPRSKR